MEANSGMVVGKRGNRELLMNRNKVSAKQDEQALNICMNCTYSKQFCTHKTFLK